MTDDATILVVDDDQDLRAGVTAMLGRQGYRTLEADDGRQASRLIDEHLPDLVILDMMMPRWGGLAVLEHFHGKADAPPFLMITANEVAKHKSDAEQLGIVDYIRKPFAMDRLLDGVAKIVPPPAAAPPAAAKDSAAALICRCPGCGSRIKAPVQLTGQTRTCPGCRRPFVVAFMPPEDEGPKLIADDGASPPQQPRRRLS
jgi:DNA-binding NtrC family response regulator